jgi:hemoglobin
MRRFGAQVYALAILVTFATSGGLAAAAEKSLYTRLGGKKAITAVVDEFVARVAADKRINGFFKATASDPKRLAKFKANLVNQICQGSGRPGPRAPHRGGAPEPAALVWGAVH